MSVAKHLIKWYQINKRDLPWRDTSDPYKIWLSEIILQQTRVNQGLDYYLKFIRHYPTITHLAKAPIDEVLKLWQGLGYYTRARNLHQTAIYIALEKKGIFPSTYKELLSLKGVGEYTAAAIASFAFHEPVPVIDGNVFRFLARMFAIDHDILQAGSRKVFFDLASSLIDRKKPGEFNQAIMEFGSLVCTPGIPDCNNCMFNNECLAFLQNRVSFFPVKSKKNASTHRFFSYLVFTDKDSCIIHQRDNRDIWQQLYEFPLIESKKEISVQEIIGDAAFKQFVSNKKYFLIHASGEYRHILSHQVIHARFYVFQVSRISCPVNYLKIPKEKVQDYPVSRLIERFLDAGIF